MILTEELLAKLHKHSDKLSKFKYDFLLSGCLCLIGVDINVRNENGLVRKIIKMFDTPPGLSNGIAFWTSRGWSECEAYIKQSTSEPSVRPKSAFDYRKYMEQGYTEEQSRYLANSKRPIRKEYWMERGYSEEDSIVLAKTAKEENNKKGAARVRNKWRESPERMRASSPRTLDYWLARGHTEESAKDSLAAQQRTFSLDICISKYGVLVGTEIWQNRQDKWLETMGAKSQQEIDEYNSRKSIMRLANWSHRFGDSGRDKFVGYLTETGRFVPESIDEIADYLRRNMNIADRHFSVDAILSKIPTYFFDLVSPPPNIREWLIDELDLKHPDGGVILLAKDRKYVAYQMYVGATLLRSYGEILMYLTLTDAGLKIEEDFLIDRAYPNSSKRYDFYLIKEQIYIEIAGMMENEQYADAMKYKVEQFSPVVLCGVGEIMDFCEDYLQRRK